ncbi:MAG: heat-inducible transcription repressor HrcA [Candidatus Latescibacteria bacterium 4484_181]|nr:MAG: heat-inducible transcription repressor HrcA [Candidatus Latescibacteria bacterium 4484_181]RKY68911.1 MAG: heat-inducible transcription repressor HrcA [Candidatus Latescibacterota bacterium]RKY71353.1 MAG: heat-inducible transcription repressor HrcA [Candidatus Latescibacterota bacterium]
MEQLSQRERDVLQSLIQIHIATAAPVSSRAICKKYLSELSPATVRNTMMDLEERGFLDQPHTSAGREPTDKGYRYYVDSLMKKEALSSEEKRLLRRRFRSYFKDRDAEYAFNEISRTIAQLSHQLGVVLSPRFEEGILQKLELIPLNRSRVLVIITVTSGLVKTITVEIDRPSRSSTGRRKVLISRKKLREACQLFNERLAGLSIKEIRRSIQQRLRYSTQTTPELFSFFIKQANSIFRFDSPRDLFVEGRTNIMLQPEFRDRQRLAELMEFLDEQDRVISLLNQQAGKQGVVVTIGSENAFSQMQVCSLVTSSYNIGDLSGTVGMIGPTRMRYSKYVSLLEYTAKLMSELLSETPLT